MSSINTISVDKLVRLVGTPTCPVIVWLIRRFVDPNAVFLFVAPSEVEALYDAFYRWCRDATDETHDWPVTGKPAKVLA
jgi:hypothetical protein